MINVLCKIFLCIIILINNIKSDIPVECEKHKIQGEWIFRISEEFFQPDLNNPKTSCTHGFPDKIEKIIGDKDYSFTSYRDIKVNLDGNYKVYEQGVVIGSWTPIYNEGFIANFKNSEFTAFMKYFKNPNNTMAYLSNCDKTMIGWYIPDINNKLANWSCFFGFKSKIKSSFGASLLQVKNFLKNIKSKEVHWKSVELFYKDSPIFLEAKTHLLKYDDQKELVDEINSNDLTWKADFNPYFKGMSFAEINKKIGSKSKFASKKSMHKEKNFKSHHKSPSENVKSDNSKREVDSLNVTDQNVVNKYKDVNIEDIDASTLPLNWDWRNVGGVNYIPSLTEQGNCGSCYVISSVTSLESRLRILTLNKDTTRFSKQYILSCNPYTEGCEGGYPILVGKFLNEFEIIKEDCFPYEAKSSDCSNRCSNYLSEKKKYYVSKYGYLGEYYGNTSEELMLKEIRANGPMPGNILVPWNFSYYKSGIYMFQHKVEHNNKKISKATIMDKNIDWLKVEHSILIVGWGEEKGVKYWIGGNSWGERFGEDGFFKILRGENECNIESMGDFLRLKVEDR